MIGSFSGTQWSLLVRQTPLAVVTSVKKKGVFYYILNARLLICCLLNYKAEAKMHIPEPGHQMVLSAGLSLPLPL
jgi:hypothetical protein